MNDPGLDRTIREVAEMFRVRAGQHAALLRRLALDLDNAADSADKAARIRALAHLDKGTAAMFGFPAVGAAAARAERAASDGVSAAALREEALMLAALLDEAANS